MCTCTKEGPVCQSLKIENCFHLAQAFSQQDILKDHVCKVSTSVYKASKDCLRDIEQMSHRTVSICFSSVVDAHHFYADPDFDFDLMRIQIRIRIQILASE
jgi:hypothetical protein